MPVYVKYTPDCWDSISVGACLMLSFLCISYHNIQFTIFSMLRSDAAHTSSSAELVSAAWQILEVVLRVSKERNSGRLSTEDLPIVVSEQTQIFFLFYNERKRIANIRNC